jgi:DNA adenine methylase
MRDRLREDYLPAKEVADMLGYTIQHTRLLIREGKLPAEKFGRDWLVGREAVSEYLGKQARLPLETRALDRDEPEEGAVHEYAVVAGTETLGPYATDSGFVSPVNVAQVPQRSPFRYPGGKTWLVPYVRKWLRSRPSPVSEIIEPFAGGGIVSLTAVFEGLADHATMVELDEDVGAVWRTILGGQAAWLADRVAEFRPTAESVRSVLAVQQSSVQNRVTRGGILAPGVGLVKHGENGRGLSSRWYPDTLCRRILDIAARRDRISFIAGDGVAVLRQHAGRRDCAFFIDPPYTVAGRRLYRYSEIDHKELFSIASTLKGDFLMTYDDADEIRTLASRYGFARALVAMKTTHHTVKRELLIGRGLEWLSG